MVKSLKFNLYSDTYDVNEVENTSAKDHREPFIIGRNNFFGCLCRRNKTIKKKIHYPLESFSEIGNLINNFSYIDIFIPAFIPGKKIFEYKGYIDAHLYIQMNKLVYY